MKGSIVTIFNCLGESGGCAVYTAATLRGVRVHTSESASPADRYSGCADGEVRVYIYARTLECTKPYVGRAIWRELTEEAAEDGTAMLADDPRRAVFTLRGGEFDRIYVWGRCDDREASAAADGFDDACADGTVTLPDDTVQIVSAEICECGSRIFDHYILRGRV